MSAFMSCNEAFFQAYIEAALGSSNDESTPEGGEPLDKNYGSEDIAPSTLAEMRADCDRFVTQCEAQNLDLATWEWGRWSPDECAGHDLWLTRNGHGVGFWARDVPEALKDLQDELDDLAKAMDEYNLYVGDDGDIHGQQG